MSNFGQAIVILLIGLATIAMSAFIPHDAANADTVTILRTLGSMAAGGALTWLKQQSGAETRIVVGGERATDVKPQQLPPPTEGSTSAR